MLVAIALVIFLILQGGVSKVLFPPTTTKRTTTTGPVGLPISVSMTPTLSGKFETLNVIRPFPVELDFTAKPSGPGPFTYLWDFGDGTSSTKSLVTHVFPTGCFYDVTLKVVDGLGKVTKGTISFTIFPSIGKTGAMVLCPQKGTAGITNVEVAGGYYKVNSTLVALVNGLQSTRTKTSPSGNWHLDMTGKLRPQVNGSRYTIGTSLSSLKMNFLTLEGIKASPTSGEPGAMFNLTGRSYPRFTTVSIYLGKTLVGQTQTDGYGSFFVTLQVPQSIHYAGTYQFVTSPPVLGAQATFRIPVSTATPAAPGPFPWWVLVVAGAAAAFLVGLLLWRRKPPVELEVFRDQVAQPFTSLWAIRVWGNRPLKRCRISYGASPLRAVTSRAQAQANLEMPLPKGGSLTFRIPDSLPVDEDAEVTVQDGDKHVLSKRFGSIPRANPQKAR